MSSRQEGPCISGICAAATDVHLRMKLDGSGKFVVAGDEAHVGTHENKTFVADEPSAVYDKRAPGTKIYVASGAIAAFAQVSSTTGGKVQTGTGGVEDLGTALTAAAADGDLVEVWPA